MRRNQPAPPETGHLLGASTKLWLWKGWGARGRSTTTVWLDMRGVLCLYFGHISKNSFKHLCIVLTIWWHFFGVKGQTKCDTGGSDGIVCKHALRRNVWTFQPWSRFRFFFLKNRRQKNNNIAKAANIRPYAFHASYKILVLSSSLYLHDILHMFCTVKVQSTPHS